MAARSRNPAMARRIARALPALSRAHRRIADYVLAHPLQVATMPIDELAATVGVSLATANRFARALEFDGYPQFRSALVLGFEAALAPVERLRSRIERPARVADVFANALGDAIRNAELTLQSLDAARCDEAVDAILGAKRIYIAGFGASSWLGGLLQRHLDRYHDHVQLLTSIEGSSHGARLLTRITPADLVIAIAFPRYFSDTLLLTRRAREAGAPVLALTDRATSPLAPLATIVLYVHADSQYLSNSDASVLALIEALASAVSFRMKGSVKASARLAEAVLPWLHGGHPGRLRPPATGPLAAPRRAVARPKPKKARRRSPP